MLNTTRLRATLAWRLITIILFILFSAILALPAPASACSCAMPGSPQQEFSRADAVFVGTVTGTGSTSQNPLYIGVVQLYHQFVPPLPPMNRGGFYDRAISFQVSDSWSGVTTTHITVRTGTGGGDCGYGFQQGQQYLVYAHEWEGTLYAGICSRTAPLTSATEDLNHLQTLPSLKLTYVPPSLNPQILCLAIPLVSVIVLGAVLWRRRQKRATV